MTDLTTSIHDLLREKENQIKVQQVEHEDVSTPPATTTTHIQHEKSVNEFLKEAYRINSHIQSLLQYLKSIRQPYLSITTNPNPNAAINKRFSIPTPTSLPTNTKSLTDQDRDAIDSSTASLLRDLSSSISNLQSAETLRQETETQLLRKKYGSYRSGILWRWAAGSDKDEEDDRENSNEGKSEEQIVAEESARTLKQVRESVLWFLRRNLEQVAEVQRAMVEKRIERVREKEKSVLYKVSSTVSPGRLQQRQMENDSLSGNEPSRQQQKNYEASTALSAQETASIESQLTAEQLQLFAEENDVMLRHYEDTLSKVQNAEKSLLEISSLQQTLVGHLSTQEEYISQLVGDAGTTSENVGKGNKELKRANERRSTAQIVFWLTTGLCVWLVVWDAVF